MGMAVLACAAFLSDLLRATPWRPRGGGVQVGRATCCKLQKASDCSATSLRTAAQSASVVMLAAKTSVRISSRGRPQRTPAAAAEAVPTPVVQQLCKGDYEATYNIRFRVCLAEVDAGRWSLAAAASAAAASIYLCQADPESDVCCCM